jgi:hypothetical protein
MKKIFEINEEVAKSHSPLGKNGYDYFWYRNEERNIDIWMRFTRGEWIVFYASYSVGFGKKTELIFDVKLENGNIISVFIRKLIVEE